MDNKSGFDIAFLDLLFNCLCCFIILFSLSFILINKEKKEDEGVKSKAELLITMTWGDDINDDVDLWVEDPLGNFVCFLRRDQGFLHLDRDDLGHVNDTIVLPSGEKKELKINQEIVTVRGIVKGEYCVNAHMYSKRSPPDQKTLVKIKLEDINPSVKLVTEEEKELVQNGDEVTFFRFSLNEEGNVVSINDLQKKLTSHNRPSYDEYNGANYNYEGENSYEGSEGEGDGHRQ